VITYYYNLPTPQEEETDGNMFEAAGDVCQVILVGILLLLVGQQMGIW
jgi:hypothetical protein